VTDPGAIEVLIELAKALAFVSIGAFVVHPFFSTW
jgi:hypothetical protein